MRSLRGHRMAVFRLSNVIPEERAWVNSGYRKADFCSFQE